jgi:hypothetical protein
VEPLNQNGQVEPTHELPAIDHILVSQELAAKVISAEIPHQHDASQVSDHFPVVVRMNLCDGSGPVAAPATVRIAGLLPNPLGDETENEEVSLKNLGGQAASLAGWVLRDRAGRTCDLMLWARSRLGRRRRWAATVSRWRWQQGGHDRPGRSDRAGGPVGDLRAGG